jgi:hypothetical protein
MRCLSLALVLTAALTSVAAAQDPFPPDPMTDPAPPDPAPPDPAPPPPPPPQPAPAPVVQEVRVQSDRPVGTSIGLGLGYGLPTSLETPNRTSARLRLPTGLTFEPLLTIANSTGTTEPSMGPESEDKITEFGVAVLGRLPLVSHGRVDLEALASVGFSNVKANPDGDFNTRTTNTFGIGWGVGIGYWLGPHWQLSMSVTNPLVQYASAKQQMGAGISSKASETTIGVIFVPQVVAMIHLYN